MAASAARILVVDDVPANVLALRSLLESAGYPVVTAGAGEEALRHLLHDEFAVVLLDVQMPGMDGFETAGFIRALERTRTLPIVFLTALDERQRYLEKALTFGMTDFVFKPVSAVELRAKIAVYVDLYEKNQALRLMAEQQQARTEEVRSRLEATFAVAPLGIGYVSVDGHWLEVNRRLAEMLDYADSELLARPLCDLVSPPDLVTAVANLGRLMSGERSVVSELRLRRRSGSELWVQLTASAVRRGAEVEYLVALMEDITDRKQREQERASIHQEVEAQRRLLESVLRQMPAGALVIEAETGRLVLANEQARALLGRPLVASARESILDAGGLAGPLVGLLARSLGRGETVSGAAVVLESRAGEKRTVEVSSAPVLDAGGRPAAAVAILHDVTALEQAKRELEESVMMRERFVGIVSHDLRNPLSAVQMSARILESLSLPGAAAASVARIQRACQTMGSLIIDLLDLTRARQAGGIPIRQEELDLAALCQRVVEEVRAAHPDHRIDFEAMPIQTQGDPERLAQALTNLLANAVKYRREETPVRVSMRQARAGARIEIHNEGEAIPADLLPHLFDAFRRGDPTAAQRARTPGLGLGLYIAQQVIQAHGGSIQVISLPELGTTFSVELPLVPKA